MWGRTIFGWMDCPRHCQTFHIPDLHSLNASSPSYHHDNQKCPLQHFQDGQYSPWVHNLSSMWPIFWKLIQLKMYQLIIFKNITTVAFVSPHMVWRNWGITSLIILMTIVWESTELRQKCTLNFAPTILIAEGLEQVIKLSEPPLWAGGNTTHLTSWELKRTDTLGPHMAQSFLRHYSSSVPRSCCCFQQKSCRNLLTPQAYGRGQDVCHRTISASLVSLFPRGLSFS